MNKFYKADKAFGDYIKKRDIHNGYFICPTCNMKNNALQAECGHFIPRKHNPVRFHEMNGHVQCIDCNSYHDGRDDNYLEFMVQTYGQESVDELFRLSKTYIKADKLWLLEIELYYKEKILLL